MKVLTIVGARPQFIKAAAVSREIQKRPHIKEIIVHTGQHYDNNMSEVFFQEMEIASPKYNLAINQGAHGQMTAKMLEAIEKIILQENPNLVMVYGDTNSTLAGALAASKLHIPIAHVEAGLRSFNMRMPEEINRILTDRISTFLLCPTDIAVTNLNNEGYPYQNSFVSKTGDVMQDAAMYYAQFSSTKSTIIDRLNLGNEPFILCTIHRAENTDNEERLREILDSLDELTEKFNIICPIHPRTSKIIKDQGISTKAHLIDPVGYFDMIELLKHCEMVLTDSGGLQKEAFFFQKQCVTMREETEWVELIDIGANRLAGTDKQKIIDSVEEAQSTNVDFQIDLYGMGNASENILNLIEKHVD
jgi:UDP-GlcNAc3NAcA epimerase